MASHNRVRVSSIKGNMNSDANISDIYVYVHVHVHIRKQNQHRISPPELRRSIDQSYTAKPFPNLFHIVMANEDTNKAGDPGLSLWLIPPEGSDIYNALTKAIAHTVPPLLALSDLAPQFEPHLTLASRIPRQSIAGDPQKWLDELDLPSISAADVQFQELAVGSAFFKRLFIRCKRAESLLKLASSCRAYSSAKIDEALYDPHVSVL